jgi:BNR/Asp-box repeat protein
VTVTNMGHAEAGLTAGMFEGVSLDGGKTWTRKLIALGGGNPLGDGCCDPSLSFDSHGNLFMTYLYEVEDQVPVALSTDGGLTFHVIANISQAGLPAKKSGWEAFSADGGTSFTPNIQISAGTSNSHDSGNGTDYGDYTGLSFFGGIAHPAWSDNSNGTGNNPDGALHQLDIYTAAVPAP